MVEEITSVGNSKYKLVKSLLLKKNRVKNGLYTVEGIKSVSDAVNAKSDIKMIFISDKLLNNENISKFYDKNCFIVKDEMFNNICDTQTPQGILAVISIENKMLEYDKNKMYICCDNVKDPGNLGTIIRTADAAGFGGVLLMGECADLYNPKTVRASMGSFFHIPVYENVESDDIVKMKNDGFKFYCGTLSDNTIDYTDADFKNPFIICVGNEATGISEEVISLSDNCLKIPIEGMAESLNVGVAAAVFMYEAVRCRKKLLTN